ncbi:O-methyltransferase [Hyunsoonleella pacifica]|uniref:Class I SAM-dependent methyltransferase n=1 Tax=Hyunsoonleella pacifica TaxID=1080224 RepID=A0A4Q9FSZ5_9FLAO|nr:class I SAM-dependent methyltransferase [Hyunsoonleella pacifica]TBN18499.1 class I SAM-dependent methyltransferase [Hyunsoonleella pacifica]GGD02304.1 O-methyltransferase [Hyunsoonleella pacifica]
MLYQAKQYIKFLLKSTNQHGVHSPFVYDLVTKCFYDKTKYFEYLNIKNYRSRLKHVKHQINITDFGAGSVKLNSKSRKVSEIVKHVSISKKNAKLLFRIAKYFKPKQILELGTSLGFATQALSLANPNSQIITIEGCPGIFKYSKNEFVLQQLDNIELLCSEFSKVLLKLKKDSFDLIFFDGNHTKQATLDYFEKLLPKAHNNSLFIFDDIYWSKDMTEAWEAIKQHPKVTVTIDTFHWGMVFFRKEQAKEHFKIRV